MRIGVVLVSALLAISVVSFVSGVCLAFMAYWKLKSFPEFAQLRYGDPDNNGWLRAKYPPPVQRLHNGSLICAAIFVICVASAAAASVIFDTCPGCKITSPPA